MKIDLLPEDLAPKKSIVKLISILNKLNYALIALFLVGVLTFLSIIIINSFELRNLNTQQDALIKRVKEFEKTEQQVILAKDRMSKINEIWKEAKMGYSIDGLVKLISNLPEGTTLKDTEISALKNKITMESSSSSSVAKLMSLLVSSNIYESLILKNFTYNPSYGYRISYEAQTKINEKQTNK